MKKPFEWKPGITPGGLINLASRLFNRVGDSRLESLGIASGQLPVMLLLRQGRALSQKELAGLIRIEQPTMAQTLARMERDGLVSRQPHPDDKRSSLISLTPTALAKTPEIIEVLRQGNEEALAGLSKTETETLINLLQRVIKNLEAMAEKKK